jgi:hypothetical protein
VKDGGPSQFFYVTLRRKYTQRAANYWHRCSVSLAKDHMHQWNSYTYWVSSSSPSPSVSYLINIRQLVTGQEFRGTCASNNPMLKSKVGECTVCGKTADEACKMPEVK